MDALPKNLTYWTGIDGVMLIGRQWQEQPGKTLCRHLKFESHPERCFWPDWWRVTKRPSPRPPLPQHPPRHPLPGALSGWTRGWPLSSPPTRKSRKSVRAWRASGSLLFSDLVGNVVHQWPPDGKVTDVLKPGGYDGKDAPEGGYIGPNGMALGPDGNVVLCQHGKRLNSPNDVVYSPDGALYFTDPPFGLPKQDEDPAKDLKFNGVFRFAKGKVEPVYQDLARPNLIASSSDYKTMYLSNSEANRRLWMRCDVAATGPLRNCKVFADASSSPHQGVPDGMRVDSAGNVYATGPGSIWVFSPDGKHLGTIKTPESPSNCAWGDDGKTQDSRERGQRKSGFQLKCEGTAHPSPHFNHHQAERNGDRIAIHHLYRCPRRRETGGRSSSASRRGRRGIVFHGFGYCRFPEIEKTRLAPPSLPKMMPAGH